MRCNLESTIERDVCRVAKTRYGVLNKKVGTEGWPDRVFLIPGGRPLFIEFKRPGEDLEPLQSYIHDVLRALGYKVETHDDFGKAIHSIATAVESAKLPEKRR